jgi:hypothetical protein
MQKAAIIVKISVMDVKTPTPETACATNMSLKEVVAKCAEQNLKPSYKNGEYVYDLIFTTLDSRAEAKLRDGGHNLGYELVMMQNSERRCA